LTKKYNSLLKYESAKYFIIYKYNFDQNQNNCKQNFIKNIVQNLCTLTQ